MKRILACAIILALFYGCCGRTVEPKDRGPVKGVPHIKHFIKADRVLILAPHPDDEAIGCAGIIQDALGSGARVRVCFLTNGDHNQVAFIIYEKRLVLRKNEFIYLGQVRRKESVKAMASLGLEEKDLVFLGYPDFGTFTIFSQYWQSRKPFKSWLTRISQVPYKNNLSYGAPYVAESILEDLKQVLAAYKPTKIFVSHPADVNCDHRSFYLFLQIALRDLKGKIPPPEVYPYLIHCVGWPSPRSYHPKLDLLPPQKFKNSRINWLVSALDRQQLEKKHKAILAYKSQTQSSAFYLLAFARKNELFGDYPAIELTRQRQEGARGISYSEESVIYHEAAGGLTDGRQEEGKLGTVSYAVVNDQLLIRIQKDQETHSTFSFMAYLFGYNKNVPFAKMPKIRIQTRNRSFRVFEGKRAVAAEGVWFKQEHRSATLGVPLELLGEPDFILASLKVRRGILPVDASAFRKIEIKR